MRGKEHKGMDGHAVEVLGFANDAEDEVCELRGWLEQQPALQGAGGDLDEGVFWNESQWSGHADLSDKAPAKLRVFSPWIPRKLWYRPSPFGALRARVSHQA
jgi:hypothetical protein